MENWNLLLVGLLILVIFIVAAVVMFTRKMPALLVLPLMAVGIAGGTALITGDISFREDLLGGVIGAGALRLHEAIIVAFFGGVLSFIMQKSGVAESLIKNAAELIGDNPLAVSLFCMAVISILFTSLGGLGAIIMVAIVFLPMLATVGVPPVVAGGVMLFGISLGGILNAGNWLLYTESLGVQVSVVKRFAVTVAVLMFVAGTLFVAIELYRAKAVRSLKSVVFTVAIAVIVAVAFVAGYTLSGSGEQARAYALEVHDPEFSEFVQISAEGPVARVFREGTMASFLLAPELDQPARLLSINEGGQFSERLGFRALLPDNPLLYDEVAVQVRSTVAADLGMRFVVRNGNTLPPASEAPVLRSVGEFTSGTVTFAYKDFQGLVPEDISGLVLTLEPKKQSGSDETQAAAMAGRAPTRTVYDEGLLAGMMDEEAALPAMVRLGSVSFIPAEKPAIFQTIFRVLVGFFFLGVLGQVLLDLKARVRHWRQQIVVIKWYAYLIPLVPLLLILLYEVNILAAFFVGFVYAILVTLRPGSMSLTIQCMIQGAAAVMPAALLMIGIGIVLNAVMGPPGWSAVHGQPWPVTAALEPFFLRITPQNPITYIITFTVLAPLALYRGPLNLWGLGFGVASLFLIGMPAAAVAAMLMIVGQIQGVCDPTNTWNVWLANELRVDVQSLMWRTIPYVWGMVAVGLTIFAFQVYE